MSTTLDESFTSLSHTPLASTHVISNVSSPMTRSTASLPLSPTRRLRSESQSTTTQGDVALSDSVDSIVSRPTDAVANPDVVLPFPLAIPRTARRSSATDGVLQPLVHTSTYQLMIEEPPFGPLLPDTPRSSAEMYGERPFSPITRAMAPPSAAGLEGTLPSRPNSTSSLRTLGSLNMHRRTSGLANEIRMGGSDDGDDPHVSTSTSTLSGPGTNRSVVGSLSERYPAPPTPPVMVSPPASSIGMISAPSSPRSSSPEVVVHEESVIPHPPISLPLLQLPRIRHVPV
ncbi:hypothetical protein JVU11DRAFT_2120 [Chiua virens]|nr:hypothetical protein JVU11DRAFT_2120 [Chiua virens]